MNNGFSSVMESLLKGVDSILSTKTVVGEPKQFGDTIILPLVDVTFGVGAGGSAAENRHFAHSAKFRLFGGAQQGRVYQRIGSQSDTHNILFHHA